MRHRWSEAASRLSLLYWLLRILLELNNQKFLFGFILICLNCQPYATASNQPVPIGDNKDFIHSTRVVLAHDGGMQMVLYLQVSLGRCWMLLSKTIMSELEKSLPLALLQVYEATPFWLCDFPNLQRWNSCWSKATKTSWKYWCGDQVKQLSFRWSWGTRNLLLCIGHYPFLKFTW